MPKKKQKNKGGRPRIDAGELSANTTIRLPSALQAFYVEAAATAGVSFGEALRIALTLRKEAHFEPFDFAEVIIEHRGGNK